MRLHLISNSHIDPVWLWDQYEGIDEVLNTFRSACDRLDEYPKLTFSSSTIQFYAWVLEHDHALFDRIAEFVRSGRWEVVGDWWVEADTNLPGRESLLRQSKVGREFTMRHFGRTSPVAFLPDTFGHPADLPMVLAESGFKYLLFCRPNEHEKRDLPQDLFYWTYRGHRVLAYRLRHHYFQEDTTDSQRLDRVNDPEYSKHATNAFLFGLGDHGGGPTIQEIECFRRFINTSDSDEVGFSTCEKFFAEAERLPDIPEYSGDLHMHAVGCYSVVRDIKNLVRSGEAALLKAERAAAMAGIESRINGPWRTLLFNQFHDILPGSMSPEAGDQARQAVGGVMQYARDQSYKALKKLSREAPASVREGEFRIFNTLPYPVTVPLAIESFVYYRPGAAFCRADGRPLDVQEVLPDVRCGNRRWTFVDTLPAEGFQSYHFDNAQLVDRPAHSSFIARAADQECPPDQLPLSSGVHARLLVLDDDSDTWSHGVSRFANVVDVFAHVSEGASSGPVVESVYRRLTFNKSEADLICSRYAGVEGLFLDLRVRWSEHRRILKFEFARPGLSIQRVVMQGGCGPIERAADGVELPLHRWVQIPGDTGFAVVQDGAFACDSTKESLRITLVRSSLYGYEDKQVLRPEDPSRATDFGEHNFRFRLLDGVTTVEEMDRAAEILVEQFSVIRETL